MAVRTLSANPSAEKAQKPALDIRKYFTAPALIFMIIVTQIPLLFTLRFSLDNWNLLRPDRQRFVGLDNYADILQDTDFWTIIGNTLFLTTTVVIFTFLIGMGL